MLPELEQTSFASTYQLDSIKHNICDVHLCLCQLARSHLRV